MSSDLGNKTPAQVYKDLFFIDNQNQGIDSNPRTVYSGNGLATNLKVGAETLEADFNKGHLKAPLISYYHLDSKDIGTVSGSYQLNTTNGNIQKLKLNGNLVFTIYHNLESTSGFELTLIVEQTNGGNFITFPSSFKKSGGSNIQFSSNSGAIDILKLVTFNGGSTWLVYIVASDLR